MAALSSSCNSICVSGTHGKTTTAAMISQLLNRAGRESSFCLGGEGPSLGGVAGWRRQAKNTVLECDESDGTLAFYQPFLAVITNIEFDHAEYFRDFDSLQNCFAQMVRNTRGKVVCCYDDPAARQLLRGVQHAVSYCFSAGADLRLKKWRDISKGLICSLEYDGKPLGRLRLPVPGKHNALNAAAACAAGLELGLPFSRIARAHGRFQPVRRRFERILERKDLLVICDYAHNPTEIAALLSSARALKRKRLLAVFQPQRYSRTKVLGPLFPPAFQGVQELILCPIYEASEAKTPGGTSSDLCEHFRQYSKIKTYCASSLRQAWDYLTTRLVPGDGLLIIGAGDVEKNGVWAKEEIGPKSFPNPTARLFSGLNKLRLKNSRLRIAEPLAPKTTLRVGGAFVVGLSAFDEPEREDFYGTYKL